MSYLGLDTCWRTVKRHRQSDCTHANCNWLPQRLQKHREAGTPGSHLTCLYFNFLLIRLSILQEKMLQSCKRRMKHATIVSQLCIMENKFMVTFQQLVEQLLLTCGEGHNQYMDNMSTPESGQWCIQSILYPSVAIHMLKAVHTSQSIPMFLFPSNIHTTKMWR